MYLLTRVELSRQSAEGADRFIHDTYSTIKEEAKEKEQLLKKQRCYNLLGLK